MDKITVQLSFASSAFANLLFATLMIFGSPSDTNVGNLAAFLLRAPMMVCFGSPKIYQNKPSLLITALFKYTVLANGALACLSLQQLITNNSNKTVSMALNSTFVAVANLTYTFLYMWIALYSKIEFGRLPKAISPSCFAIAVFQQILYFAKSYEILVSESSFSSLINSSDLLASFVLGGFGALIAYTIGRDTHLPI